MKDKILFYLVNYFLFMILVFGNIGCNPIEAITDTYADIVEDVFPEDDKKDDTVGSLSVTFLEQVGFANAATATVTVLDQNGDRLVRSVRVDCTFTNRDTNEIVSQTTGVTVDGQSTCSVVNASEFSISFIGTATAEGVTSSRAVLNLSGTSTTT
jgi:hypothetical protein